MTLRQRLRAILTTDPHICALCSSGITYDAPVITYDAPGTIAEQMRYMWEGSTVRDQVLREALTRISVKVDEAAVSWIWEFQDGSSLAANTDGVFVL